MRVARGEGGGKFQQKFLESLKSAASFRANCSTVGLYCVTITLQKIFRCSDQVTVAGILLHVTAERRLSGGRPRSLILCEKKRE